VRLRLGTRGSRLALVQTQSVADALAAFGVEVEVVVVKTSGDRLAQVALADFGGKALFVKEIEEALEAERVDVAVHSLKDMPAALPSGLCLAAFPPREDPRDTLVTRTSGALADLPPGAVVGSSSLRRRVLLLARRPDLCVEGIRGNVDTRLAKLDAGAYDAIVLAQAGLNRLGLAPAHAIALAVEEFLPAAGQGILGLEAREGDRRTRELVGRLDDARTRAEAEAERGFLLRLEAGCHAAVAGYAHLDGGTLGMRGLVASPDGAAVLESSIEGPASAAAALGDKLASELLARGARGLLEAGRG
jgi:hydroxymethylbilane synthase